MNHSKGRRIAGLVIMAASVGYVIWRLVTDDEALDAVGSIHPAAIAGLVVLHVLYLFPQAYRYRLALEHTGRTPLPAGYWFRLFILGRFLNSFLPQAGNAYRAIRLKEDYNISITRYLSGFVAFTWLSTLLNLAVAVAVIAVLEPDIMIGEISGLLIAGAVLVVLAFGPPAVLWLTRRFRLEHGVWGWAYRRFRDLVAAVVSITRSRPTLVRFTGAGFLGLGIAITIFTVSFRALNLDGSVSAIVLFFVLLQLSTYVNITPGNLGVMELGFGALGSQLGIGMIGGLLVAALVRITGYAAILLVGLLLGGIGAAARVRRDSIPDQVGD